MGVLLVRCRKYTSLATLFMSTIVDNGVVITSTKSWQIREAVRAHKVGMLDEHG